MTSGIADRVERVRLLRQPALPGEPRPEPVLRSGLCDIAAIRSWASAAEAKIVSELQMVTAMPEASIAEATRSSINAASRTCERAVTLDYADGFDGALVAGSIVTGHVDELTKAAKKLDDSAQRDELFERSEILLADASRSTIEQFRKTLAREVKSIQRDDGMERLERQQRATSLSTLSNAIDRTLTTVFAEQTPVSCPTDPVEKQKHLRALSLARLVDGDHTVVRAGVPEFVAVIDVDQPNGNGEASIDWGIDVEVPARVVAELVDAGAANVTAVVVRNGVIVHAPGDMNVGRSARHASGVRCEPSTALVRFRAARHDTGWTVTLDEQRQLTVTLPDGNVMTTGPPTRLAG